MDISSRTFSEGEMIPERCAYGRPGRHKIICGALHR